jgi:hypothetical protein
MTESKSIAEEPQPRAEKREWIAPKLQVEPLSAALSVVGGPAGLDGTGYS